MTYPVAVAPNEKQETRASAESIIWDAIVDCANSIFQEKGVRAYLNATDRTDITGIPCPNLKGWRLVEILCALTVLDRAHEIKVPAIRGIAGKVGPIQYRSRRGDRFLWTQPNMTEGRSGLTGRPDIVITDTSEKPSHVNAVKIIECKGVKSLGAPIIRAEFAKSYDLRIRSYLMWSYHPVSPKVISGARLLGLNVSVIGIDAKGGEYRRNREALRRYVAEEIERTEDEQLFAQNIEQVASEEVEKRNRITQRAS